MKEWPERLRLFVVLAATRALLARSKEEGWGVEDPQEALQQVDQIIDVVFFKDRRGLPKHWSILYAPTGPLQEIAMANGWSDAYMKLAEELDGLEPILKGYEAEPCAAPNGGPGTQLDHSGATKGTPSVS